MTTESWEDDMTMEEIYCCAIAWAKRELLRAKIARGETASQTATNPKPLHSAERAAKKMPASFSTE